MEGRVVLPHCRLALPHGNPLLVPAGGGAQPPRGSTPAAGTPARALLLHQGTVIGDIRTETLEEKNLSLTDYIKQAWNYRSDRVLTALENLNKGE